MRILRLGHFCCSAKNIKNYFVFCYYSFFIMQLIDPNEDEAGIQALEEYQKRQDPYKGVTRINHLIGYVPTYITRPFNQETFLIHEVVKLPVSSNHAFIISNMTFNEIKRKLENYYHCTVNDIQCTSILFKPIVGRRVHYYFQWDRNPNNSQVNMKQIGAFKCFRQHMKLSLNCPFVDSYYQNQSYQRGWALPFYKNNEDNDVVPTIYFPKIRSLILQNDVLPFLGVNVQNGLYYLTGIEDNIAFQCAVYVPREGYENALAKHQFRRTAREPTPWRRSHHSRTPRQREISREHIPRYMMGQQGEIQYEIPSQDIEYDNNEDPLLAAFQ